MNNNLYNDLFFSNCYDEIILSLGLKGLDSDLLTFCAKLYGDPILEIGCGTGLKLLELAGKGYNIVGLDSSFNMLTVLKNKIKKKGVTLVGNVQVVQGDMVNPPHGDLINRFSIVYFAGSMFLHLTNDKDRLSCLMNCSKFLHSSGVIIIVNSHFKQKECYNWKKLDKNIKNKYACYTKCNIENNIFRQDFRLEDKQTNEKYSACWCLYPVEHSSMLNLIKKAGLRIISTPDNIPIRSTANIYLCAKA
ncbi:MAG: class I SAM-dependent methyltransferase [Candidatus Electrothrix sp. YB6]